MSRARRAAADSMFMIAGRVITTLVSVLSIYLYTKFVDKGDYALVALVAMFARLCYGVSSLGLGLSVTRRMPRLLEEDRSVAASLGRAYLTATGVGVLICCGLLALVARPLARVFLDDAAEHTVFLALLPVVLMECWANVNTHLMYGTANFRSLSIINVVSQFLRPTGIIALYWGVGWGKWGLLVALGVTGLLTNVAGLVVLQSYLRGASRAAPASGFIRSGWPFYAEGLLGIFVAYIDQWLIGIVMTKEMLGLYAIPRQIFERMASLLNDTNTVMLTNLSGVAARSKEVVRNAFHRVRRVYTYMFVPVSLGLLALAYLLFGILIDESYAAGADPFFVFCITFAVLALLSPYSIGLMALASPTRRLVAVMVQSVVLLGGIVTMGAYWQLVGVALAVLAARIANSLTSATLLKPEVAFTRDTHAWSVVVRSSAVFLVIFGAYAVAARTLFHVPILTSWLVLPVMIAASAAYGWVFMRLINEQDMATLEELVPRRLHWALAVVRRFRPAAAAELSRS